MALGLASGLGGWVLRGRVRVDVPAGADTIDGYLRTTVSPGISVSMYLGPARANRKPVLQLLTPQGTAVGFAKIGFNSLTRDLIRDEHATLVRLGNSPLREITVPRVLHYGEWHGLNVLTISALPVWQRHQPVDPERLARAMHELAQVGGLRQHPLADSDYLRQLHGRLSAAEDGPDLADLRDAVGEITARMGHTILTFGAWHGDWAPWNMASTGHGLLVWDWERFQTGVPLGFDALHHWIQSEVGPRHRDPAAAASACLERATELLAPFGIGPAEARLTAALYLADLATRYLVDRQAKAGALLGAPGGWLIPALAGEVARLPSGRNGSHPAPA